ncbi:MAG: sugar phosphate isomerase/epimerase [Lachnospiraceae bacterium]|nr:sugar phosphate isomerase/epimerase [Lachnospiraceae bacterium]
MKKVCAIAGTIMDPSNPRQSIKQLRTVGIEEIMFDFSLFVSAEGLLIDRYGEEPKFKPALAKKYYEKVIGQLTDFEFLPSIARLPFLNVMLSAKNKCYEYTDLNELILRINRDCIVACEEIGCKNIIIQPLFAGIERGKEWKVNRNFYLELASACRKKDTRLLLINQCQNHNGHFVRGVCSEGFEAAQWIDELNKEVAMERFGFCLDIGNCNLCGLNMQGMIKELSGRIQAVILTENDGRNMAKLLPFTSAYGRQSVLDWLSVIRGLRELSYDGYLILETVDTTVSFSPLLQPYLFPIYNALLDYFEMQISIEKDLKRYEHIALFGAGNMCRNYMKCYGEKYPPLFTCDNNSKLWNTEFEGLKVKSPEELRSLPENSGVIICNIFYREIEEQLRGMGIKNIGYFNDEYMPSFYFDRLKREEDDD